MLKSLTNLGSSCSNRITAIKALMLSFDGAYSEVQPFEMIQTLAVVEQDMTSQVYVT